MSIAPPEGEFKRQLAYARSVRDGRITDPDFLPLLFTFPLTERPDLDPLDPSQWWRGMPSLRTDKQPGTMDAAELERELKQAADADDQESFALTLSQRLGIERNDSTASAESILHLHWDRCPRLIPSGPYDFVAVGIDAGGLDDPAAVCIARRPKAAQRRLELTVHQFLTQTGYDRAPGNLQEVYDEAIKNQTLHVHETTEAMRNTMFDLVSQAGADVVGGDEHGQTGFAQALKDATGKAFSSVPQTWVLGAALASLEGRLLDGAVSHSHCPLLMANVDNLLVEELANGNRRLKKRDNRLSGQGYAKIDGIISVINATALIDEHGHRAFDAGRLIG
ncbi:terminase TerL endonuclease subunit [Ruegeria atlantica]|uniref:Phage terminase-like protein, large subunit n=1 Tax=Ruegeria atlantica TaxID=81569 RepID=A0A0P1EVE3_9RHOB|nr:terminase TerL endonuclease subunit [Ruegeria atlantica]CUH46487.1 Phage terminase-like protein, large subunit [Ruegeria atlantica]